MPFTALPANCENNSQFVGINGTPVIDPTSSTLYLIAYTYTNKVQQHFLHAVATSSLDDVVPPVEVRRVRI